MNCDVKRTKINKKRPEQAQFLKVLWEQLVTKKYFRLFFSEEGATSFAINVVNDGLFFV